MLNLSLRLIVWDSGPAKDDYQVIWTSDEYGEQRVGRIRLAEEMTWQQAETWLWNIVPPGGTLPVGAGSSGRAASRDLATAAFRRSFERFHRDVTARQWTDAIGQAADNAERRARGR